MTAKTIARISTQELYQLQRSGQRVDLLDVRTEGEFGQVHVPGARLIPLDTLTPDKAIAGRDADGPIYIICQAGHRSMMACKMLAQAGLEVVNVDGGTLAWERAGLPVEKDPRRLRITR